MFIDLLTANEQAVTILEGAKDRDEMTYSPLPGKTQPVYSRDCMRWQKPC